jgi:hypothetical protein
MKYIQLNHHHCLWKFHQYFTFGIIFLIYLAALNEAAELENERQQQEIAAVFLLAQFSPGWILILQASSRRSLFQPLNSQISVQARDLDRRKALVHRQSTASA